MDGRRVVVGAAIVRNGRMIAARRRAPSPLAGGWEFPGGKVEPGESEEEALVRECEEELGVRIECGPRLPGEWPIGEDMVLRVYAAHLTDREPEPGEDHDELRWLAADELYDVAWLPADLPAVAAAAELLTS
ncbi:MAG: (deoxy)nucleoside triphosphate pyrophosphohydrolase [Sporichthyaceae bacterium]